MCNKINKLLIAAALFMATHAASATTLSLDYSQYVSPNTACPTSCDIGHSINVGGLTASAYYYDNTSLTWKNADLWVRNENPTDHGFGVCSPGESCGSQGQPGSGDGNELSQGTHQEVIVLTRLAGYSWSDLVVSSLDSGGTGGAEQGTLSWSDTDFTSLNSTQASTFLTSTLTSNSSDEAAFSYGTGGNAASQVNGEGSIMNLASTSSFNKNANTLVFTAGAGSQIASGLLGGGGSQKICSWKWGQKTCTMTQPLNNDYLVQGALLTHSIPEPDTLALMGLGLIGLLTGSRLKKRG